MKSLDRDLNLKTAQNVSPPLEYLVLLYKKPCLFLVCESVYLLITRIYYITNSFGNVLESGNFRYENSLKVLWYFEARE